MENNRVKKTVWLVTYKDTFQHEVWYKLTEFVRCYRQIRPELSESYMLTACSRNGVFENDYIRIERYELMREKFFKVNYENQEA